MDKPVKSRIFIKKCGALSPSAKADIDKAVQRVLVSPSDHQFKRDYLTPYKQEHPTDKQLTIFFEHLSSAGKVFFTWINDPSCLHDTRKKHGEDPCIMKFKKLQAAGSLEQYSEDFHEGKIEITPRSSDPHFFDFNAIDIRSYGNILKDDGYQYYCMGIEFRDTKSENIDTLFIHHAFLLLKCLHGHFKSNGQRFEFRIPPVFNTEIINYLNQAYDKLEWQVTSSSSLFILAIS